jgi:hypothetical protein
VYLDHFKTQENATEYLRGRLYLRNNQNPNECILVQEIPDVQFSDIVEPQEIPKIELGSNVDVKI